MWFSRRHPFILIIYFFTAIGFSMFNINPLFSSISMLGAILYRIMIIKPKKAVKELIYYFLFLLIITVINPLFSHNGKTVLFFINDNAVTTESFIYGFSAGRGLISVICWFSCFCSVMSSDKIIYLLSGVSSKLALLLSSSLKFVPEMNRKFHSIYNIQKCISNNKKGIREKLHITIKSISSLVTWMIESTAETSDSMDSRGYGLKGRTSFNFYTFKKKDILCLFLITYIFSFMSVIFKYKIIKCIYYPEIIYPRITVSVIIVYLLWLLFVMIPFITEMYEECKWKLLKSKI